MSFDSEFEAINQKIDKIKELLEIIVKKTKIFTHVENERLELSNKNNILCAYEPLKNPRVKCRGLSGTIYENDVPIQTFKMDEMKEFSFSYNSYRIEDIPKNYVTSGMINWENSLCFRWQTTPESSYLLVEYDCLPEN